MKTTHFGEHALAVSEPTVKRVGKRGQMVKMNSWLSTILIYETISLAIPRKHDDHTAMEITEFQQLA